MELELKSCGLIVTEWSVLSSTESLSDIQLGAQEGGVKSLFLFSGFLEQRMLRVSGSKPGRKALSWQENQDHSLIN